MMKKIFTLSFRKNGKEIDPCFLILSFLIGNNLEGFLIELIHRVMIALFSHHYWPPLTMDVVLWTTTKSAF